MGKVVLDEGLRAKLNGLNQHLEICEPDGQVVGHVLPDDEYRALLYEVAKAESARQEAEDMARGVVRKWDGTNGKTTAEAIAYLENLGRNRRAGA